MPNVQPAGVYVTVSDQSQYTPGSSGLVAAFVGTASKGSFTAPQLIGDAASLVRAFGYPSKPVGTGFSYYPGLMAALSYLQAGNSLYYLRVGSGGALANAAISTWSTSGTTATATATISGYVDGATVGTPGSGYTTVPTVTFSGGGGSGATGIAVLTTETVTGITITNPGSGYTSAPTITITGGGGTGAVATATISASVTAISVSTAGTDYNSVPYISIAAPASGVPATATATVANGGVSGIQVVDGGTGYTTAPAVTVESGVVTALSTGSDGNNISYSILPGTASGTFKLVVSYENPFTQTVAVAETFDNLSITGSTDNVTPYVNGVSQYIMIYPGNYSTNSTATSAALTGGADGTAADSDYVGVANGVVTTGMQVFSNTNTYVIDVIAAPGVSSEAVVGALGALASGRQDCMALLDPPDYLTPQSVVAWASGLSVTSQGNNYQIGEPVTQYTAIYWPWCRVYEAYSGTYVYTAPSGPVAQVYASATANGAAWTAPAGPVNGLPQGVYGVRYNATQSDLGLLASNLNSVNPIVALPVFGIAVMDQTTTWREYSDLHSVNVVRLVAQIVRSLRQSLMVYLFSPNDPNTWNQVEAQVDDYLASIQALQGIYGYQTTCDSTNNTPQTIAQLQLMVNINIQPTLAARTINVGLALTPTTAILTVS